VEGTGGLGTGAPGNATQASPGHTCILLEDQSVKCWGDNDAGGLGTDPGADG